MTELPAKPGALKLVMGSPAPCGTEIAFPPIANLSDVGAFDETADALWSRQPTPGVLRPLDDALVKALTADSPPFPKRPPGLRCAKQPSGFVVNCEKEKAFPAGCMAWSCPKCSRVLAYRVRKRLEGIEWTAKVEFTLSGDGAPTRENNLRLALGQRRVLQFVRRYFRRKYGDDYRFRFARMHGVGERGGRLHSHMVWDADYIPKELLEEHAEACGLGVIVFIRAIDRHHDGKDTAANYVADQAVRYVANQAQGRYGHPDLPRGARRFQSSGVPAYEPEPGWHWQECYPEWGWDPRSEAAGRALAASLERGMIEMPDGSIRVPIGIERSPLGFLSLSSLVLHGETASADSGIPEKARQLRWGQSNGFT